MKIIGIFPPILTPFDDEGAVDLRRLRTLVAFWKNHVHGMYVCGSYGSGPLMDPDEREQVLETVVDEVAGEVPIVAHIGAINTTTAIRLAQHAELQGVQAVAAIPPYYYTYNEDNLFEYFNSILESIEIPLYVYDNPKTTGNPISSTLMKRLAEAGVSGVKDSSFDIGKLYKAMRVVTIQDFDFVIGSESLMLPAFSMGIRGCISGLANALPEFMKYAYTEISSDDRTRSQVAQANILKLWDMLHIGPSVSTAYEILHLRGIDAGFPRSPLKRLDENLREQVTKTMKELEQVWNVA